MIPPIRRPRDDQRWTVAHGPEQRGSGPPEEKGEAKGFPAEHLDLGDHELLEKLDRLDNAVFEAIAGDATALENVRQLWPQLSKELARPLLAESQEHYLRRAVSAWETGAKGDAPRDPQAAVQLLDVLATLFG